MGELNSTVLYDSRDNISFVTLNRPDRLNALNDLVLRELESTFQRAENDPLSKVVVLRGIGRAFCSGGDVSVPTPANTDENYWKTKTKEELKIFLQIVEMKKPVICGAQGYAIGMGFGLMMACDVIFVTEDAKLGTPEIRYGASSTEWVLPLSVGRNKAMEMFLTGDLISGKQAAELGIINKAVLPNKLDDELLRFARKLTLIPMVSLVMNKAAINRFYLHQLHDYMTYIYDNVAKLNSSEEHLELDRLRTEMPIREYLNKIHAPFKEFETES